ncbi:MAG: cobyrinate a,c-diamide synthase, partial [Pseudomonadota bacterium]
MTNRFMIAAPRSGSGKTVVTLGLLRALRRRGVELAPYKAGPDYIDPAFHAAASGETCFNLDPWGMRSGLRADLFHEAGEGSVAVVEAMMGLFDGAADGSGSAADLATELGLPVVLVVDVSGMSDSVAPLVAGFQSFRSDVTVAAVILNKVGSARHEAMLRGALGALDVPVLGCLFKNVDLDTPSRHLGLVQAGERTDLEEFLDRAADAVERGIDMDALLTVTAQELAPTLSNDQGEAAIPFAAQHLAIAQDPAFSFLYPHLLKGWQQQGMTLSFFSPLADEAPSGDCDGVFLPGGYPELWAGKLAGNRTFLDGLRRAADRCFVYGECGGYMVLGDALVDADGVSHGMAGLLPLETSFAARKLSLGYRRLSLLGDAEVFADQ